jgi:two-component system, LuxR family, sensor kinase FixL
MSIAGIRSNFLDRINPGILMFVGVTGTLILFGWVIWQALGAYSTFKSIQADEMALDRMNLELTRLDEQLSVLALIGVSSGSSTWNAPYHAVERQLDSVLARAAAALDTTSSSMELSRVRQAHQNRVATERRALELSESGDRTDAQNLLLNPRYQQQKSAYIQSIASAIDRLNDRQEYNSGSLRRHLWLIAILTGSSVAVAWASIMGAMQASFRRRKSAERILRESELRYRALTEVAFDDILLTERGVVIEASEKFARMIGYLPAELRGLPVTTFIHPDYQALMQQEDEKEYSTPHELVCVRRDGSPLSIEACGRAVPFHRRSARVIAIRDISPRKQNEAEREALIQELKSKNDELERFTYTVSHDLRSPLITIGGWRKRIEHHVGQGKYEHLNDDLARVTETAQKMEQFVEALLRLSQAGQAVGAKEPVPFAEVVAAALRLVGGRIQKAKVKVVVAPELPVVYGDRTRLMQVVLNLVDNAIKFMGDQPHPRVDVGSQQRDGFAILYVGDNGIGIEPGQQDSIFGLFSKLDAEAEGSGVGLALVKRIVEQHGGSLWLESEGAGKGSRFCFRLPLYAE